MGYSSAIGLAGWSGACGANAGSEPYEQADQAGGLGGAYLPLEWFAVRWDARAVLGSTLTMEYGDSPAASTPPVAGGPPASLELGVQGLFGVSAEVRW